MLSIDNAKKLDKADELIAEGNSLLNNSDSLEHIQDFMNQISAHISVLSASSHSVSGLGHYTFSAKMGHLQDLVSKLKHRIAEEEK